LDDAIDKALKLYELARIKGISSDDAATQLGYKNANNGAYLSTQATMGYYGLLVKKDSGLVGVPEELQAYKFNPNESERRAQLLTWLKNPKVFADMLEKFPHALPSDKTLIFNFVSMGFTEQAAEKLLKVFKQSVEFSGFYGESDIAGNAGHGIESAGIKECKSDRPDVDSEVENSSAVATPALLPGGSEGSTHRHTGNESVLLRTPIRLSSDRIAWLETPIPFFTKDKGRLIKQIDLMLCDDEDQ
jgi:hypothetical protein